jgi:DNA helicase-2/ATP-dependent DNA helicase PcrA
MTRARDRLAIFRYADEPSLFVGELFPKEKKETAKKKAGAKIKENVLTKPTPLLKKKKDEVSKESVPENLVIGERITQARYGDGVITDVTWDDDEIPTKFTVEFDSGAERIFMYPFAFTSGMRIIE